MEKKIFSLKDLSKKISIFKKKGKKVVHCHGVFDILHAGHIKHFNSAKKFGDILVVSVTQDRFVNKGPNRPIFPVDIRMQCLAALENVDYVCSNSTGNAVKAIKFLKPNFYCKGKDYIKNKLDVTGQIKVERKAVKSIGGRIVYTDDELYSSSKIINTSGFNLSSQQKKFLDKIKVNKNFNNNEKISKVINSYFNLKVLVIGETIIDEYVFCEALGKSGKEPVLALKDLYKEKYLGGAAAIARNLSSFCKKITLLSSIGENKEELAFIKKCLPKNVKRDFLAKKNSTTIVKKRFIDSVNKNKVLGVYSINDNPLNKNQSSVLNKKIIKQIKKHDLVIVSDYGHGFISSKSAKSSPSSMYLGLAPCLAKLAFTYAFLNRFSICCGVMFGLLRLKRSKVRSFSTFLTPAFALCPTPKRAAPYPATIGPVAVPPERIVPPATTPPTTTASAKLAARDGIN